MTTDPAGKAKALVLGLILGYSAGVITYCWIHILCGAVK